ncbi:glycosyltransferase [Pluralibacter gergoviae]|uniref:glycosyltransferase n=1 Tax=Pluralibacter gergoviae TaxID=61647 RepID=UPI00330CE9C8|nr:glycosyltransferase [Pluralibacter gergoviae]
MRKKKVLVLSHTGAISHFKIGSHHYASQLAENGFEVYYSGVPTSMLHRLLRRHIFGEYKLSKKVHDIRIKSIFPITFKNNYFITSINKLYWKLCENISGGDQFDIIICDYPFFVPLLSGLNYRSLIYRPTDVYSMMAGDKVKSYEKEIIKLADKIVCTSNIVKNALIDNYKLENNYKTEIEVLENGYDSDAFYCYPEVNKNNCVYIGTLDERFSFEDLLFFSKSFPNVQFDIYGPESKLSKAFSIEYALPNVSFKGPIAYSLVPGILNNYKVGLLPLNDSSQNKGRSPMKLWEFYSCGLNVVYTNIDHIKSNIFFKYTSENKAECFSNALNYKKDIQKDDENLIVNTWKYKTQRLIEIINAI